MTEAKAAEPICGPCRTLERDAILRKGARSCRICQQEKPLAEFGFREETWRSGGGIGAAICGRCQYLRRPPKRASVLKALARRRRVRGETWDGVTDREILDRDAWECQMPTCVRPEGRAIPQVRHPDPWSPSMDHVLPLVHGGADTALNKRAAHLRCNMVRKDRIDPGDLERLDAAELYQQAVLARQLRVAQQAERLARAARERALERQAHFPARRPKYADEVAAEAHRMRCAGMKWQEISDRLGMSGTGTAYAVAKRHAPLPRFWWGP